MNIPMSNTAPYGLSTDTHDGLLSYNIISVFIDLFVTFAELCLHSMNESSFEMSMNYDALDALESLTDICTKESQTPD